MNWHDFDTRLGAYALIIDHARVLLALGNVPTPEWGLPGGGVELDESPEQAAIREVHEETGYRVELDGLLGVDCTVVPAAERLPAADRPLKRVRLIYRARIIDGALANEIDGSTDEARWMPLGDVAALRGAELVDTALALLRSSEGG